MYGRGGKKGTIRFAIRPGDGVKEVLVAGDFSDWRPVRMIRRKDGTFVKNVSGVNEKLAYKFIVDGEWVVDPDHSDWIMDPFHSVNSIARVAN